MNRNPNVKEALLACLCFSVIGLFNLGLHWEERTAFVENITWELKSQLTLSGSQTIRIMEINYDFYDNLSNVANDLNIENNIIDEQISRLIDDKNRRIMDVLSEDQQSKWIRSHLLRDMKNDLKIGH